MATLKGEIERSQKKYFYQIEVGSEDEDHSEFQAHSLYVELQDEKGLHYQCIWFYKKHSLTEAIHNMLDSQPIKRYSPT